MMTLHQPVLGAIADDLTGATDLALALTRGGMRVRLLVGVPDADTNIQDADAVVVSLKSRTIPAAQAVRQSCDSTAFLLHHGISRIFFKYCSTFDSTDAGNIGPVTDALMALLDTSRTIACPAFPANGRTVYKGHLFVGDQLLSDSPMRDHPLTPMRDSNLLRLLARQTSRPVRLVDLATVRSGTDSLRAQLMTEDGIVIVDALTDDDLHQIGAAVVDFPLITGGSGVALGLPAALGFSPAIGSEIRPSGSGRQVVLAGSCSAVTRRQIAAAEAAGWPGLALDPVEIAEGRQNVAMVRSFAGAQSGTPVIYASAVPERVAQAQSALGTERAGTIVEAFLAELARNLSDDGFNRIIVAGGESSGAVIEGLGIRDLAIGQEIDPGVPWMYAQRKGRPMALALKSGNFGAEDMFLKAWDLL